MSKSTVTKLFVGSVVAVIAGILVLLVAVFGAFASGAFVMSGHEITGFTDTGVAWTWIGFMVLGVVAIIGGAIAGLVSWIGALLNTFLIPDKAWFVLLLILGLLSFGFVAMVAYVIAGPDGTQLPQPPRQLATPA